MFPFAGLFLWCFCLFSFATFLNIAANPHEDSLPWCKLRISLGHIGVKTVGLSVKHAQEHLSPPGEDSKLIM